MLQNSCVRYKRSFNKDTRRLLDYNICVCCELLNPVGQFTLESYSKGHNANYKRSSVRETNRVKRDQPTSLYHQNKTSTVKITVVPRSVQKNPK